MPAGRVHTTSTLLLGVALLLPAPWYVDRLGAEAVALVPGCIAGILLSPDLDVDRGNVSHRKMGDLAKEIGWIWRVFWWPYAKAIRHRHWLSHGYIAGTAIRLFYIWLFTGMYYWLPASWVTSPWVWWWVAGLVASDCLHTAMDFHLPRFLIKH